MLSNSRREVEKHQLRQQILDAAGELFAREGYENVSMRKIASRIGYSATTIYLYFKDKDELFSALCEETFAGLIERLRGLHGEPLDALRTGLRTYIDFGLAHPNHYAVTFMTPRSGATEQGPSLGPAAFDTLRQSVTRCIAAGLFPGAEVETTSQLLWSVIHGVTSLLISVPSFPWVDRNALIDELLETQLRGLTHRNSAQPVGAKSGAVTHPPVRQNKARAPKK
jgi:AcrR family transcriptional regulator